MRYLRTLLLALALLSASPIAAEPISYVAGNIFSYTMTSTGSAHGPALVTVHFNAADTSFVNSGPVSPGFAAFNAFTFSANPISIDDGFGGTSQVLFPMGVGSSHGLQLGDGIAKFSTQVQMGSVVTAVAMNSGGQGGGSAVSLNPFPATPPGQNGMTFLGEVQLTDSTTTADLSLFGPDSGGIFAITLLQDDPNFNFVDFIANGGQIDGSGAFQMIGGSPGGGGGGTEVPEPLSIAAWAVTAGLGLVVARRFRK